MILDIIKLRKWNRPYYYLFDEETSKAKRVPHDVDHEIYHEINQQGIIKTFTLGFPVVIYSIQNKFYIVIKNSKRDPSKVTAIYEFHFTIFYFGLIRMNKKYYPYFDIRIFAFLSPLLDPTYDELDRQEDDFAGYFKDVCK